MAGKARTSRTAATAAPARAPRQRREPEVARALLMDAAERVFEHSHPDDAGLQLIAREAGVSHALITHYFGTYAGLIEATLERRMRALREQMLARLGDAVALERPEELLAMMFDALDDTVLLRLMRWIVGSERPTSAYTFAFQDHGLQLMAHEIASALVGDAKPELVARLEVMLIVATSAAYGYALCKRPIVSAAGRRSSRELDTDVQRALAEMLRVYVFEVIRARAEAP